MWLNEQLSPNSHIPGTEEPHLTDSTENTLFMAEGLEDNIMSGPRREYDAEN